MARLSLGWSFVSVAETNTLAFTKTERTRKLNFDRSGLMPPMVIGVRMITQCSFQKKERMNKRIGFPNRKRMMAQ